MGPINRRQLLAGAASMPISGVAAIHAVANRSQPTPAETSHADVTPPDLSFLSEEALVDHDRARHFMKERGLDALVMARPANVFYLSNHWPQLDRMGFTGSAIAIYAADPSRPLALVMHAFLYYYTHAPESDFEGRLVFPYTQPTGPAFTEGSEPPAAPARSMRINDPDLVSDRERHRRAALDSARPASADASWALAKALRSLKLGNAVLGYDDPELRALVGVRGLKATMRPAENTIRKIRLAKSPTEIRLMRLAAKQNVQAAMASAQRARDLGSTRELRAAFFAEAARRGNQGVFMVIDGSSSEVIDEPLRDGMSFSIDCVSACRHYHGDFARTVFVGEPLPQMKRATAAIRTAWLDIQSELRAGLRFSDIPRIGRESMRKQGMNIAVSFRPHSVGLYHTDQPQPSLLDPARAPEALVLEENMVLSVDCPVFEAGLGGTAHLEDLMLIRKDGAEPIHDVPESVIVV